MPDFKPLASHIDSSPRSTSCWIPAPSTTSARTASRCPGRDEVTRVVTGRLGAARADRARGRPRRPQLVLVHHGLFWDFHPTGLTPVLAERLRPLFKHDIALAAYHLPLDAHPEVGNNALLAERARLRAPRAVRDLQGTAIGRAGTFAGDGIARGRAVRARARGHRRASRSCSTAARSRSARIGDRLRLGRRRRCPRRVALGLDAFLTGEPREHVMADAREAGHPLHRRRPLRDRDVRRPRARRSARRALRDRARLRRPPEPGLTPVIPPNV